MRLDEYLDEVGPSKEIQRRHLAKKKSYRVLDYLDGFENRFNEVIQGDSLFGSTSPSIFVGRSTYPKVPVGVLSPVGEEEKAEEFSASSDWYNNELGIENVLRYRTGLLNSNKKQRVDNTESGRFSDVRKEIAMAEKPVDVEVELSKKPSVDVSLDAIRTPTGPNARARKAVLAENPSIPRAVEKAYSDDDWKARDAVGVLYEKGLDVYEINNILSAGVLGVKEDRKLVPTRWSITAVDDMVGQHIHGDVRDYPELGETQVHFNEYIGNRYWVILEPGQWEFELIEIKSPGSVWNPAPEGEPWIGTAYEGFNGRSKYVEETAGAYYASRLAVLEHLCGIKRQAKALVIRDVGEDYWAPVGVWQIRESVRNAFSDEFGEAESLFKAVRFIEPELQVSMDDLRRKSTMLSGLQSSLGEF